MFTRFIPILGLLLCISYWTVGCIWVVEHELRINKGNKYAIGEKMVGSK